MASEEKKKGGAKREEPYNPLDKRHLGESVADALLARPVAKLPPQERFIGAGVYAIYYTGDFPLYAPLVAGNKAGELTAPIYVGKAVPKGSRKGGAGIDADVGTELFDRLRQHAATIRETKNLDIEHFACRYLVVDDIWIPLGESLLIKMFTPVWNQVLDGFGIHAPGGGRDKQKRSQWDVLHPGRGFADKLSPHTQKTEELEAAVRVFLARAAGGESPKSS